MPVTTRPGGYRFELFKADTVIAVKQLDNLLWHQSGR